MSTASTIPETWDLDGDDARRTMERTGRLRLLRDAFARLRWSDGFSHARSIAFLLALLFIEGVIALVGLASVLGSGGLSDGIVRGLQSRGSGSCGSGLDGGRVAGAPGRHRLPIRRVWWRARSPRS